MRVHDMRVNAQHRGCGRVGSGVRRALSFFDVQVASWWDLDEAAASLAAGLHRRQPALLGMGSADGERRKEGVSKGQTAHFMIRNDSSKTCGNY